MGTGDHLQEQKDRALKLDNPSSAEVRNVWSDASSPTCALISWYVIKFRDNPWVPATIYKSKKAER